MISELFSDLKYGVRTMIRSPGFTLVALFTMALGIGANTAVFSLVHGVVLQPLPYPQPDRIVFLMENNLEQGWESFTLSPANYLDWRERNRSLELFGAYQRTSVNYTGGDRPQSLSVQRVTEDFLEILGGEPFMGRGLTAEDLASEAQPVAILSHGFWQRALGGDPEVLDRTITLDDVAHLVVVVLPEDWQDLSASTGDLILPLTIQPQWYTRRGNHFLRGLVRLKPGVTVEQARAEFSSIAAALGEEYPDTNRGWGAVVRPLKDVLLGSTGNQLFFFMATVGLVLLIACANLANMTLARAAIRVRELAIRTAVGAGRARVVRQLLAESVLLSAVGGVLGVAFAYLALEALTGWWPGLLPRMNEVELNAPVLLFSLVLSLASGVIFGLAPALSVAGPGLADSLRQGGRSLAGDRSRRWMRSGLVVAEMGLAVILLVGTGLLVRSFGALQGEDPGFRTADRLVLATPLPRAKYAEDDQRRNYAEAALAGLRALPGVERVALTTLVPLEGSDQIWGFWKASTPGGEDEDGSALFYRVSPGYFDAMGIPLLAGRDLSVDDGPDEAEVVVVSASFAEAAFPGENAVGQRIRWNRQDDGPAVEIVGVVGDVHHYNLGSESIPQVYVPYAQRPSGSVSFVLEAALPPLSLVPGVRDVIESVDQDQPLVGVQDAEAMVSATIAGPRFRTLLMSGFGLIALVLAVVGLYGVMAYSVAQRAKEIGVRMALGATRTSVLGLVFREGAPLLGAGLVLGLGGAFALSRILESMLFGVGARDPGVFLFVPVVLAAVATLAMVVPARRASRVDPVKTLGEE
jgi:putative ABC transport system permease protein